MKYVSTDEFIRLLAASLDDPEAQKTYVKLLRELKASLQTLNIYLIPNIRSTRVKLDENLCGYLPKEAVDCVTAGKIVKDAAGKACIYPLIRTNDFGFRPDIFVPEPAFGCFELTGTESADTSTCYCYENWNGSAMAELFYYMPSYYGEAYGHSNVIAFGFWRYDKDNNCIVTSENHCLKAGDWVAVKYQCIDSPEHEAIIPVEAQEMLRYHVMMNYWGNTDPRKSNNHYQMFKRAARMYRHKKLGNTQEDVIIALQSAYRSTV